MSDLILQAKKFQPRETTPWLLPFRNRALTQWCNSKTPTRKTEDWRYLNLRALSVDDYWAHATEESGLSLSELQQLCLIPGLDCYRVAFVNGVFSEALSALEGLAQGVHIQKFSECEAKDITPFLNSTFEQKKHLFSQLNASQFEDGLFIRVQKNTRVDKPIQIVNVTTAQPEKFSFSPRVLIVAEAGSESTFIEHYVSSADQQSCFINSISECCIKENASVNYYQLLMGQEDTLQVGGIHATLEANARLGGFYLSLGSALQRTDLTVTYKGPGAEAKLQGVYLPRGKQQVDYHTCMEHAVPHCVTDEVFRGIVSDSAKAVFNGRIHIHRDAQKTLAQLSNKNLLTSNKAEVDTKPELEIYADDVQCAHGATVAQLDLQALHYLKTRGVSEEEAKVLLSFGFINELIEKIKLEELVAYLRPVMAQRFAKDSDLARHIL